MDPVTIFSTATAAASVVDLLAKTLGAVSELRDRWNTAEVAVATFEAQLIAVKAALTKIQEWMSANSDGPHYQLEMDLGHCLSHCTLLVSTIDAEIADLERTDEGQLDVASKIRLLFKAKGMNEVQKMLDVSLSEQKSFLERAHVRKAITKIEEDNASMLVHRDADSLWSGFTAMSISSSKRSLVFDFDGELMLSRIYRKAFQGSVRKGLWKQQGKLPSSFSPSLEIGREIRASMNRRGWTSLHGACRAGNREAAEILIRDGANIDEKNKHGKTPLSLAAGNGHVTVAELLLDSGAEMETKDEHGNTPLLDAYFSGYDEVMELLLDRGAEMEAKNKVHWTALLMAARSGSKRTVEMLLDRGAQIEMKDKHGETTLFRATAFGKKEAVEVLLRRGADMEVQNYYGGKPIFAGIVNVEKRGEIESLFFQNGLKMTEAEKNRYRSECHLADQEYYGLLYS